MVQAHIIDVYDKQAICSSDWDAVIVIGEHVERLNIAEIDDVSQQASQYDQRIGQQTTLLIAPALAGGKLILAPVVGANNEYQDVRLYAKAAQQAIATALAAGATKPLIIVDAQPTFSQAQLVALLACGQGLWQPLERREAKGEDLQIRQIGLLTEQAAAVSLNALEAGRILARDLCGTEPERMSAAAFADYCQAALQDSELTVEVVSDRAELERDYPLLCAVARSSFMVQRHHPRVVRISYQSKGPIERSYFFAGKGVVYDTGGADIKVAGGMAGMSRDKGGAAAVAGLMKTLSILKPKGVKVVAELGLVRNSVGSDAFVTDEIITSHAGVSVRIGNTDAEGRLVLADLLSHLRLQAENAPQAQLFSVATLTGHVVRCYGGYTALVENSVAYQQGFSSKLANIAEQVAEPMEVSRLRSEDFAKIIDPSGAADVISSNNAPSSVTARGHQYPAAFLLTASGLNVHGVNSDKPLPYIHIDIAGSATVGDPLYGVPTATPLVSLFQLINN
ncbi:M17 family metallopeptidase [Shewanella marina]|uniref:M17 family metallopeptidase n=1 Tax=Shewanella marina TaxID=487319 RepID=UPI00046E8658|nr:leucyl aminopeptidase family protein [Shewanella marina]